MISVIVWKWATPGYRSTFGPETVNVMRRMVARHYLAPHRFICVTNDPAGLDGDVEVVADREDFAATPSPHGGRNPSCYRRLRMFSPDAAVTFGARMVSIDLDCVITGDLRPLWDRPEDFVAWRDPLHRRQYNGSMMLLRAGSRPQVWSEFDPKKSPHQSVIAGFKGSDQGWISQCLPPGPAWSKDDGVYSFKIDGLDRRSLPADARVTIWHGHTKPWDDARMEWVQRNYR